MFRKEPTPDKPRTIFAFVAPEGDGLIVAIGHSESVQRRLAAIRREAARGTEIIYGNPLTSFLRYCSIKNLSWDFHELATYTCDMGNADWYKYHWNEAAMVAGLYPKFFYDEVKSREIVERIASGEQRWLPEWPKHLVPSKAFINPFYEYFTSKTFLSMSKTPLCEEPINREEYEEAVSYYIDYLFDQVQDLTHLPNAQAKGRKFFLPLPHLGHTVTALERKGVATEIGDRWIDADIDNRRMVLALLEINFDQELIVKNISDDELPPYTHAGVGLKLYENRKRSLKVEEWKERIQNLLANDMGLIAKRPDAETLMGLWCHASRERMKKLQI